MSRPAWARPWLLPLFLGVAIVVAWVSMAGGHELALRLRQVHPIVIPLMAGATIWWLAIRFIRWQYLLRRAGVRVPIRSSITCYLAGLPGTATPAYVGEIIRGVILRRKFGTPLRLTTMVLVEERLFDVAAIALMLTMTALGPRGVQSGLMALTLALAGGWLLIRLAPICGIPRDRTDPMRRPGTVGVAALLSLAAWAPPALLLYLGGVGMGIDLGPPASIRVFSAATLGGAATLMPAGIVSTGSIAILQLRDLGLALADSVVLVSLMRLMSTGFCLTLGTVFLARELVVRTTRVTASAEQHFDEIATEYGNQFLPHVWDHLIRRKLGFITDAIPGDPITSLGLDLGCGLGLQCRMLRQRGYRVFGVDPALGLLRKEPSVEGAVAAASAIHLPFADSTFDFVYTIGVLHHLPGPEAQEQACREVARVLKPGGAFIVHESNPRNPLFRFYMGYLFPVLKSIDEGTEWWIDSAQWQRRARLHLERIHYFTFLPDFLPAGLMRPFLALERWLEGTRARSYSVHYAAVLRRAA